MCISLEAQFAFYAAATAADAHTSVGTLAFAFNRNCMDENGQRCITNNTNITLQM